ncbi:MAG TPA: hypothetical protein DCQ76_02135 [Ruminococcaceae bacterium]|nr:hypothetical protein [Oscillospiraceae bacterium]
MKQTISLDSMTFVGVDNMPFDVNQNEPLELEVKSSYDFERMYFYFKNNGAESVVRGKKASDGSQVIEVPKELLTAGKIDLTVSLRDGMKLLKKWVVSPLLITEYDEDLFVSDYLKNIEEQMVKLNERVKALEEKNDNLLKL